MITPDPDLRLVVTPRNPGQFFACCGVLELASRLWPGSEGWFGYEGSRGYFHIATWSGHNNPLGEIVRRLCEPEELVALAEDHEAQEQADRKPVVILPFALRLDWWLDSYRGGNKSELKVWAGQQTPERNINRMREAWREIVVRLQNGSDLQNLLLLRWPLSGRFGFDPAASWDALDVGFSPDEQTLPVQTSPATEILAAIGLQRCRPVLVQNKRRWFAYHTWRNPLEVSVLPAAIVGAASSLGAYEFPVVKRNEKYSCFGWARRAEVKK
jgi:CRISPR-associated protein Csx14